MCMINKRHGLIIVMILLVFMINERRDTASMMTHIQMINGCHILTLRASM